MTVDTKPQEGILPLSLKGMVLVGPARLEEELAVISCFFQRFYLPCSSQSHVLKSHKLAELALYLAD